MKQHIFTFGILFFLISCHPSKPAEETKEVSADTMKATVPTETYINYLNVPGPIQYDQEDYLFAWSSKPASNYYKQEYLTTDEVAGKYMRMIILELSFRDLPPKGIAEAKIKEIQDRKRTDPIARYTVGEDKATGEVVLDFILSDQFGKEKSIVEWNVYRYRPYTDPTGRKGIKVFGFSKHEYGANSNTFVSDINVNRSKYIASFLKVDYPEIKLIE